MSGVTLSSGRRLVSRTALVVALASSLCAAVPARGQELQLGRSPEETRWDALGRVGLLLLERSGGGSPEGLLSFGARGRLRLLRGGPWHLGLSSGYLLGAERNGTGEIYVATQHHLLDLRVELGVDLSTLHPRIPLVAYLAGGGLVDVLRVEVHAFDDEQTAWGAHGGASAALGFLSLEGPLLLSLEVQGIRRASRNAAQIELGVGIRL